jgi:hypothetical protein
VWSRYRYGTGIGVSSNVNVIRLLALYFHDHTTAYRQLEPVHPHAAQRQAGNATTVRERMTTAMREGPDTQTLRHMHSDAGLGLFVGLPIRI